LVYELIDSCIAQVCFRPTNRPYYPAPHVTTTGNANPLGSVHMFSALCLAHSNFFRIYNRGCL